MKSMMSAISAALRVVVPWSRSVATISATPGLSAGSCAEPARTSMRTLTTGCSFWRTTTTCRPFGSVRSSYCGNVTGCGSSGRGGRSEGQPADWAQTTAGAAAIRATRRACSRRRRSIRAIIGSPPRSARRRAAGS